MIIFIILIHYIYFYALSLFIVCSKVRIVGYVQNVSDLLLRCWQGVKFMYDCVTGKQIEGSTGCIMADEMVIFLNVHFLLINSQEMLMMLQGWYYFQLWSFVILFVCPNV